MIGQGQDHSKEPWFRESGRHKRPPLDLAPANREAMQDITEYTNMEWGKDWSIYFDHQVPSTE